MKVFLDTNVLVSAFATRGLCADVLRHVLSEHEFVTSEVVLAELRRVLRSKIGLPADVIHHIEALLRTFRVVPTRKRLPDVSIRDKADLQILAAAQAVRADVFVTGDRDLLDLPRSQSGIRVTDPRGFWSLMRRERRR